MGGSGVSWVGLGWVYIGSKLIFNTIFEICKKLGAQRAPNEGLKGPQMPSAGARRKGP